MFMILRTLVGLVVGWVASAVFALLGRHNQGSLTVRPDRRQFVRNAALGAVGSVLRAALRTNCRRSGRTVRLPWL